jgi:hypothetical protein
MRSIKTSFFIISLSAYIVLLYFVIKLRSYEPITKFSSNVLKYKVNIIELDSFLNPEFKIGKMTISHLVF